MSIGLLVGGTVSLSTMVTVMVPFAMVTPLPVALLKLTVKISLPSTNTSSTMGTSIVLLVSPAANDSVPLLMV